MKLEYIFRFDVWSYLSLLGFMFDLQLDSCLVACERRRISGNTPAFAGYLPGRLRLIVINLDFELSLECLLISIISKVLYMRDILCSARYHSSECGVTCTMILQLYSANIIGKRKEENPAKMHAKLSLAP